MSEIVTNPALLPPGTTGAGGVGTPAPGATGGAERTPDQPGGQSFAAALAGATASGGPSFSKHALDRLTRRGIDLDGQTLGRLTEGLQRAAGKGARNSVVFVDGTAFVASVQNNTVITAVTPEHMRSHVFTNIDSAVIARASRPPPTPTPAARRAGAAAGSTRHSGWTSPREPRRE